MTNNLKEDKNIFLWGIYDILHEGHIRLFEEAGKLGDLYVITVPDKVARGWKDVMTNEEARRDNILKTGLVKNVFVEALPDIKCFNSTRPDIFGFGYDRNEEWAEKMTVFIKERFPNCEFVTFGEYGHMHSSDIKNRINEFKQIGFNRVWIYEEPAGEEEPDHQHPFDTKLFIISGDMSIVISNKEKRYAAGDIVEVPRNTTHSAKAGPQGCKYVIGERD